VVENTSIVLQDPKALATDHDSNRLLVVDTGWQALIAIDLATDEHTLISGPPQGLGFIEPTRLAVSPVRGRAWIADNGYDDLIEVDLATGNRSLLQGDGDPLHEIRDLAVDEIRGNVLVLRSRLNTNDDDTQIYTVDMTTGDRAVLSDNLIPNSDNPFYLASVVVFDTAGDRLVVLQRVGAYAVDPVTGSRMVFTDAPFGNVVSAVVDPVLARVIAGEYWGATHTADLVNGVVQPFWRLPAEYALQQLALDSLNDRLLVQRLGAHNIGALDLSTGEFHLVY